KLDWNGLTADGSGEARWDGHRVVVEPAQANTSAGQVAGRFEMEGKRWVLNADVEHTDPRAWHAFHLDGWPQGDLTGTLELAQNEHHDMTLATRLGPSTLAGWRADSAWVRLRSPAATTDTFTVDFVRRGGDVHLRAGTRHWGWEGQWEAKDFPLDEWPDGRASGLRGVLAAGRGNVVSRSGTLSVDGVLGGRQTDWLGSHFATWNLSDVHGRLLPTPDLQGSARLGDLQFLGLHFDSSRVDFHLGEQQVA